MASVESIRAEEARFVRVDKHVRELIAAIPSQATQSSLVLTASINLMIGNAVDEITTGVVGCLRVDFDCIIVASFLQEFDGITGDIELDLETTVGGASSPTWTSIVASAPPAITSDRFNEDITLTGWTTGILSGTYLRWSVTSAADFTRILHALRVTRV